MNPVLVCQGHLKNYYKICVSKQYSDSSPDHSRIVWVVLLEAHMAVISVLPSFSAKLGVFLHVYCYQNSPPCSCRTEILIFCWLSAPSCPQLLEAFPISHHMASVFKTYLSLLRSQSSVSLFMLLDKMAFRELICQTHGIIVLVINPKFTALGP